MYTPQHFQKDESAYLEIIKKYNFATLIHISDDHQVRTVRVPVLLEGLDDTRVLKGHVAFHNPIWKQTNSLHNVLVCFDGPHAYISPQWYWSEQRQKGTAVPTWNYVTVNVSGKITWIEDFDRKVILLDALSEKHEGARKRKDKHQNGDWKVGYIQPEILKGMVANIVAFEIKIEKIEGSIKMSQNKSEENKISVMQNLIDHGGDEELAVAEYMNRDLEKKMEIRKNEKTPFTIYGYIISFLIGVG